MSKLSINKGSNNGPNEEEKSIEVSRPAYSQKISARVNSEMIGSSKLNSSNFNNPESLKVIQKEMPSKTKRKSLAEKLEKDSMAGRRSSKELK